METTALQSLALSYNRLGRAGLRQLLRTIPARSLRSLRSLELDSVLGDTHGDIGDTHGDTGDIGGDIGDIGGDIGGELARYLQQAGCALCHLSLAGNHLRDGDIDELARCLPGSLRSLELSANPGLGPGTFRKLRPGLGSLRMHGCGVGDLDGTTRSRSREKIQELP
ncbi:tonsoku-like protein [Lonchura striata]